ncbi:hypothetical protein SAMN04488082_103274 [Desulfomicrobium apsheronum]|uniref:Lipoprotein n=1 Tax=Desulfomicrobium apsheronum TaxID=52560 RepID=A0A1I3RQ91_9BACT|nr:hypothetical protein [Desulfomicrobium apsheronum]MDY0225759.1 hypothetical protein [Desulfomicrobium apsheronum]SFJ48733.1 hypothetical protein SAMN04488082_103274 [Desulfomicrobium apsheronum]
MRYLKLILVALLLSSWGCATFNDTTAEDPGIAPTQNSFYYDFKDIRVPEEMEIQPKKSIISPMESGKYGTIVFRGRAEPISLFDFFFNNMPKDGWSMVTYQKYQRYHLVFTKENRVCMISIEESPMWYTWLEIKVSPKVAGSSEPAYSIGTPPPADPYQTYPPAGTGLDSERTLSQ